MCGILGYLTCLLLITSNGLCAAETTVCVSPVTLLEGRRKIDGIVLTASNSVASHPPSEVRLDDNGWCSGQLGADIHDPWLQVNFNASVLFTAIVTEGANGAKGLFLERYQVELAREDDHLLYLAKTSNSSQPAIFPLEQSRINSTRQYTEQLPVPLIGRTMRINPYEWSDDNHACTKLEVYGCPLCECQAENQLGNNDDTVVIVNGAQINHDDLFDFGSNADQYCVPTNTSTPTLTILFPTTVLLTEVGIRGSAGLLPLNNQFVKSFSLSYVVGNNFTNYTRANGLTIFNVPDYRSYYFALWPPIRTMKLMIIIHDWQSKPCLNFWMSGCNSSDVVEHTIDPTAPTAGLVTSAVVTETTTTTNTVILTTTIIVTTTVTNSPSLTTMAVVSSPSQFVTLTPSSTQRTSSICSKDDDDDDNDTPIYILIGIVAAGLLVIAVIAGVIMCRRYHHGRMRSSKYSDPLIPSSYGSINAAQIIAVDNDLYGQPELQTRRIKEDSNEKPLPHNKGNEYSSSHVYAEPSQ